MQARLCFSPLPVHLLLERAVLQRAELSQSGLQLLFAVLHLLLQLRVEAAELHVVRLDVRLFRAQLLDSGLQLRRGKQRLLIKLSKSNAAGFGCLPLSVYSGCSPDRDPGSSAPPPVPLSVFV